MERDAHETVDDVLHARAVAALGEAFTASQLGMPSEDRETALESVRIILDALLVDHLAPDEETLADRIDRRSPISVHWQRMVTTAVTNTFVLGGGFVQPDELIAAVDELALELVEDGPRRRPRRGHGVLVLRAADDLAALSTLDPLDRRQSLRSMPILVDLVAVATIGAASEPPAIPGGSGSDRAAAAGRGRWASSPRSVAATFGIPEVTLVEVTASGWACDACGCLFLGRVEGTVAHPDRFAPVGRSGPCDAGIGCACHAAPVQRNVR